jgi:tRNA A37 threonylcarbamoyltransferase TsaD
MKTKVIRTAITELDEEEAYDLVTALRAFTDDNIAMSAPTAKQLATAKLFGAQLAETLG